MSELKIYSKWLEGIDESKRSERVEQLKKLAPNINIMLQTMSRLGVCKQLMRDVRISQLYNGKIANLNHDIADKIDIEKTAVIKDTFKDTSKAPKAKKQKEDAVKNEPVAVKKHEDTQQTAVIEKPVEEEQPSEIIERIEHILMRCISKIGFTRHKDKKKIFIVFSSDDADIEKMKSGAFCDIYIEEAWIIADIAYKDSITRYIEDFIGNNKLDDEKEFFLYDDGETKDPDGHIANYKFYVTEQMFEKAKEYYESLEQSELPTN